METNPNAETLQQLIAHQRGENLDLPEGNQPETEQDLNEVAPDQVEMAAASEVESETPDQDSESVTGEEIVIDGKTFKSEAEAYRYTQDKLRESETERMILQARQEAYEQGIAMGRTPQQAQAAAEQIEEVDDSDEFYSDPQGYLKKKTAGIREQVANEIRAEMERNNQEQALWREFFERHPDLDGYQEDVQVTLNRHQDTIRLLATKDKTAAMDRLASETRKKFQTYMERMKPRTVLPNTKQVTGGTGNGTVGSVTPKQKESDSLDFVSQLRSMRK